MSRPGGGSAAGGQPLPQKIHLPQSRAMMGKAVVQQEPQAAAAPSTAGKRTTAAHAVVGRVHFCTLASHACCWGGVSRVIACDGHGSTAELWLLSLLHTLQL